MSHETANAQAEGLARAACPMAFLHDCARCLALVNQGRLQLNRLDRLEKGSVSLLAAGSILKPERGRPRSERRAPGISFMAGLLGRGGLIGADGPLLRLAGEAHNWLGQPAHVQIDQLRQIWWLDPATAVRWLPWNRREESLASHWHEVILETSRWVCGLMTDEWIPVEALLSHLKEVGLVEPVNAGANLPSVRQAVARQTTALARFLACVALPRLALVESRGRGKSLRIRPTQEGATWLRAALARAELWRNPPSGAAVELAVPAGRLRFGANPEPPLVIEPDLHLSLRLDAPALCTFELAHIAELACPGPPARYRITRQSLHQAVGWGYPVADVLFVLTRYSDGQLPPSALSQLESWREEIYRIDCEPGYRLRIAAPPVLDALRRRDAFRSRTERLASGHGAWVSRAEARELFRYLRRMGYALSVAQDPHDWPLQPRLRQPLPLSQLLVVLRTYAHLRKLVPGLAALDLGELEQALASSLPAEDLAGVERLIGSHAVFLNQHLKRKPREQERAGEELEAVEGTGTAGEEEMPSTAGTDRADLKDRLEAAVRSASPLDLTYADTRGQITQRRIRPLHLETRWGRSYLLAYCELRQDERHFRLDRIVELGGGETALAGEGEGQNGTASAH